MIAVKSKNSVSLDYVVRWYKGDDKDDKDDKGRLEFTKDSKKTVEMNEIDEKLKNVKDPQEKSLMDEEKKRLQKAAMKDWSDDKSKDEGFKDGITSALEKILGDEHKKDNISIGMDKVAWKKLKAGTLTRDDLRIYKDI